MQRIMFITRHMYYLESFLIGENLSEPEFIEFKELPE